MQLKIFSVLKEGKSDSKSQVKDFRDQIILIKQVMGGKSPLLASQMFQDQIDFIQSTLKNDNYDSFQ